jgi:hypothetical protein
LLAVHGELEKAGLLLAQEFDRRFPGAHGFIWDVGLVDARLEECRLVMDRIEGLAMHRPLPGKTDAAGWFLLARRSFRNGEHVIKQGERVPLREAMRWRNYRALLSSMTMSLEPGKEGNANGKANANGRAAG